MRKKIVRAFISVGLLILAGSIPSIIGIDENINIDAKTNTKIEWEKEYYFTDEKIARANCIRQTNDDGFIICGYIYNEEDFDFLLFKINEFGDLQWYKTYDKSKTMEWACHVEQTTDGGFIIAGRSYLDFWVIKTDAQGDIEWDKIFDYGYEYYGGSIIQTDDGGYALSFGSYFSAQDEDFLIVVKMNEQGHVQWDNLIENAFPYEKFNICQTSNGGYIICGSRYQNYNRYGILFKLDSTGDYEWHIMHPNSDYFNFVEQTSKGTFIACGDGDDAVITEYNQNGYFEWYQQYFQAERFYEIHETDANGYITIGEVGWGEKDCYIAKLSLGGNIQWNITLDYDYKDIGTSIIQASDGGYICCITSQDEENEISLIWVTKIKSNTQPDAPVIQGPTSGSTNVEYPYTFYVTDSDGDDMSLYVEWGDGSTWTTPCKSGEEIELTHYWQNEQVYTVRANVTDIYGATSEWGTLEVSIPKTKTTDKLIIRFLEFHPILYQLLQRFLKL